MSGNQKVQARRERSFAAIDVMPGDLRQCVYEFGYAIVQQCLDLGIKEPRHIRQLVCCIWDGARSPQDRPYNRKNDQKKTLNQLDWLLLQASGEAVTAATLARSLRNTGLVIVPIEPYDKMVDASIAATGEMGLVSKREKHKGRLRAAIRAGAFAQ